MTTQQIKRAIQILEQLKAFIQATQAGKGYFLLPVLERGQELQLLGNAVALRLADLQNPEVVTDPTKMNRVKDAIKQMFTLVTVYINQGDAFPPDDAEAQEALLFLLEHVFD